MKKLLFLLLAAAAVTACDNDEERNGKQSAVYDGMLIVTNKTQIPNIETISKNVRYELAESNDGTITLTMPGIKFVSNMPALTIVIPKLEFVNETRRSRLGTQKHGDADRSLHRQHAPYPDYRITDFYGEMTPETLSIRFNCSADITLPNGGKLILDHDTKYTRNTRKINTMKPEYRPFVDELIELCIKEDIGDGDHTSLSCIPGRRTRPHAPALQAGGHHRRH